MVEDDRDQLVPNHDENGAWGRSFSDREEEKIKLRVHLEELLLEVKGFHFYLKSVGKMYRRLGAAK